MKKTNLLAVSIPVVLFICNPSFAFAQKAEQLEKAQVDINKALELRKDIEKPKKPASIEDEVKAPEQPKLPEAKTFINKIEVAGATLIPQEEINQIIKGYENQELAVSTMQQLADRITDAYRKKGFVTSRAYLPPQKIANKVLEIRVIEGITGDITVKGNRYFKSELIKNKITLKKGEAFNYENLRRGLSRLNQLPDRNAKAVLVPGKEPGTTDVILEVKDRLPIHIGFDWDNYGSRYIDGQRFRLTLTDNNLLGFDDVFTFQAQTAQASAYDLFALRYLFPLTQDLKVGFFAAKSRIELQKEYKGTDTRGKYKYFSLYFTQSILDKENISLSADFGFDYKDLFNFANGLETSRDRLRNLRLGFDFNATDNYGRTLFTEEFTYGLARIMGGLDPKDPSSSVTGAGGKFLKNTLNLVRLQKMPFDSLLLWKNQAQLSPYILTAAEQFQLGGIANVRGYAPAEAVGDTGSSMTWEWSFPVYLMPKKAKVPFSQSTFYDAFRVVGFYDWGWSYLHRPSAGVKKNTTLRAAGAGVRFNLKEDLSLRYDIAWPLDGRTPSDGKNVHQWMEFSKTF
jgi:hemolysin activation/secretion protein